MSKKEVYNKALATYGIKAQTWMAIEECAELANALAKRERGRATVDDVITELADVSIMVEQLAEYYGVGAFIAEKERKIARLEQRLEGHE